MTLLNWIGVASPAHFMSKTMALSSLCVYGDSDSDEETTQEQNVVLSIKKPSNVVQEKGKSKKVKVSLPKEPDTEVRQIIII